MLDTDSQSSIVEETKSLDQASGSVERQADRIMSAIERIADEPEYPNLVLAPEEVATLQSLILRYDRVIENLDFLNLQIESLLAEESIKACDS